MESIYFCDVNGFCKNAGNEGHFCCDCKPVGQHIVDFEVEEEEEEVVKPMNILEYIDSLMDEGMSEEDACSCADAYFNITEQWSVEIPNQKLGIFIWRFWLGNYPNKSATGFFGWVIFGWVICVDICSCSIDTEDSQFLVG